MHKPQIHTSKFLRIFLFLIFFYYPLPAIRCPLLFAQDKIIAIVNKDIITQKDLNDFLNFMRVQLSAEYKGRELESKIQSIKLDLLDKLIEDRLILQEAKRLKINISPERIKARINEIRRQYISDGEFQSALAKQGLVQADIEQKIKEQMLMYAVIELEIRRKIKINPGEVTDFYQKNMTKFVMPELRGFESLTMDTESMAEEVYARLKSGESPQQAASQYSLNVNTFNCARNGQLNKDIEEALYQMNVGEISRPINIENSYYIFKLNTVVPPRQQNLSEVQDVINAMLLNEKMQEALKKWLDEIRARSYIKIS